MAEQQHYLSQCYLDGFTIQSGPHQHQFWTFEEGKSKPRLRAPRPVAKRPDYYQLPWHENPRAMEDFFCMVENKAAPVLKRLRRDRVLPQGADKHWLMVFVGIHYLRVPHMRDTLNNFISELSNTTLAVAASHEGGLEGMLIQAGQATEENVADVAASVKAGIGEYKFQYADNAEAGILIGGALPTVMRILDEMRLHLGVARAGHTYITGDRPVSAFAPGHGGWDTGLGMKHVEVAFPISSCCCLIFNWTGRGGVFWQEPEQVESVNQRTATFSTRLLIGTTKAQVEAFRGWQQRGSGSAPPAAPTPP